MTTQNLIPVQTVPNHHEPPSAMPMPCHYYNTYSHPDGLQTKYFGFNSCLNNGCHCLGTRHVFSCSSLASSFTSYYLGSNLIPMTRVSEKRATPTHTTLLSLKTGKRDVRLLVIDRMGLRGGREMPEDP